MSETGIISSCPQLIVTSQFQDLRFRPTDASVHLRPVQALRHYPQAVPRGGRPESRGEEEVRWFPIVNRIGIVSESDKIGREEEVIWCLLLEYLSISWTGRRCKKTRPLITESEAAK